MSGTPASSRRVGGGSLTDVGGLLVGMHQRTGRHWLTGTTVILAPSGAVAGVDVRGGAPGTRETDLLRPENLVQQVHAICLTGGSAFGLAAADGVMGWLAERSIGFPVGDSPDQVVPIVPSAVIFDLGRGGVWSNRPTAQFGAIAAGRASDRRTREGTVGAGAGARSGGIKGGQGTAGRRLADGTRIGALAVVNSIGSVVDPGSGLPHHPVPALGLRRPSAADRARLREVSALPTRPLNTTIGVVATDATLTPAEATKLAQVAHDGLARAVRPAHLMTDGDTIFALATGTRRAGLGPADAAPEAGERVRWLNQLLAEAAECFADAVTRGVVLADGNATIPAFRDLCPSAFETNGRRRSG